MANDSDIICITETHLKQSDIVHRNSQPNKHYIQYRKDRVASIDKGGIIMFIGPHIKSTPLKLDIPQLEFLAAITLPTPENELIIITIYRRPNTISIQCFIQLLQELLSNAALHQKKIVILGDFNEDSLDNKNQYLQLLSTKWIQATDPSANYQPRSSTRPHILQWDFHNSNRSV